MTRFDPHYFAALLNEHSQKQSAFNEQIDLEFAETSETYLEKHYRQEYLKLLAARILHINQLMDAWLETVELDIDL